MNGRTANSILSDLMERGSILESEAKIQKIIQREVKDF
jgi:hypothetical protein